MLHSDMATFRSYPTHQLHAPGSQESLASFGSSTATDATHSVMAASSDTNSQTTADTEVTSPTSPYKPSHNVSHAVQFPPASTGWRMRTPEDQTNASDAKSALASPMSVTTPVNGHKRMASGQMKYPQLHSPVDTSRQYARPSGRACSVGSTGSRASEAATNLKERLTYAMAKVQHGWEHHNIDQVEQLAAAAVSPRTVISPRSTTSRPLTSPRSTGLLPSRVLVDHFPAPFHEQIKSAPLPVSRSSSSSTSPPPKRRPVDSIIPHYSPPKQHQTLGPSARLVSPTSPSHRRTPSHPLSSPARAPTTPKADHRPATIRTQTQTAQAEQEAMSALLLMGSPGAFPPSSQSQQSSAAQSPRRSGGFATGAPRMALQYRSESGSSVSSSGYGGMYSQERQREMLRGRGEVLDQIEAET
ncbi:hypothetical protein K461DRAFT_267398 [Myriangium duriaei CBS 260.36]|uniref:Uncharacterized protein n=1 Tax=Myriangium duriaei CBS 260.36 TaxID=1168546 RepID=A0A9P4J8H1_9PEZI|nr:hypothetical protein K461DRAFT_267398 [Myriangium duriaei CBS 260.36]